MRHSAVLSFKSMSQNPHVPLESSQTVPNGDHLVCMFGSFGHFMVVFDTFYMFAYCGLVVEIQIHLAAKIYLFAPLPTSTKSKPG